jgi:hypothetical protein
MPNQIIKAIVTKYALTNGPSLWTGEVNTEIATGMFSTRPDNPASFSQHFHGNDWHRTKRSAIDDVLDRYARKKKSLTRAIQKLDAKRDKALKAIEGMEIE